MNHPRSKNLKIINLFSGSKGNCTYIEYHGKKILLDAGKNYKSISDSLKSIGSDIGDISDIFITHEHSDHISAIPIIIKNTSATIHMMSRSVKKSKLPYELLIDCERLEIYPEPFNITVGDIWVQSFLLPHDSAECIGYKFTMGDYSLGYACDCGTIPDYALNKIGGCSEIIIESNYDENMLVNGIYPQILKKRIASDHGHLSNIQCASYGVELCRRGALSLALAHLSEENNTPDIAYTTTRDFLDLNGLRGVELFVLSQSTPTIIYDREEV